MRCRLVYILYVVAFAVVAWVTVLAIPRTEDIDSSSYRAMVCGGEVCRPYASRVLHPAVVRCLMTAGVGQDKAFAAVNIMSAVVFYVLVLVLMQPLRFSSVVFLLLTSPLWWVWGGSLYIQDMFAAMLAAALFITVRVEASSAREGVYCGRRGLFCIGMLILLMQLTRESSAVFALALAVLAWCERDRRLAIVSVAAMITGMAIVAWVSRDAQPNVNELDGLTYLACKAIANGLRNIAGLIPWNDGYATRLACYYPDPPLWKYTLPTFLQRGNVHEIGIYTFLPETIVITFGVWLLYFPGILLFLGKLRREWQIRTFFYDGFMHLPLDVKLAFVSGGIFWILVPFCGTSLLRYAGYAWPLFWIALPYWLSRRA